MDNAAVNLLLQTGGELSSAHKSALANDDLIALPKDYQVHDLERYREHRRRFRGAFATSSMPDFAAYVKQNAGVVGAAEGFVASDEPTATVFFNLNDDGNPGHADWTARLELEKTAAYKALLNYEGKHLTQRQLADWLEDWQDQVCAYGAGGELISLANAVGAINKLDIKSTKQSGHETGHFHATKSALEQVEAKLTDAMPHMLGFECEPYNGLQAREFKLRVSILTRHEDPKLVLRLVKKEAVEEDIVLEFKTKLREAVGDTATMTIGAFKP